MGGGERYKQQQQPKMKVHVVEFANTKAPDKGTHYYEAGEIINCTIWISVLEFSVKGILDKTFF